MIKNYVKTTYRSFIKHKSYSTINIAGLSIGMACCILILAYMGYEFSFDDFHENGDHIYRLVCQRKVGGRAVETAASPTPLATTLVNDFPEVTDAVRIMPTVKRAFHYKDKKFLEPGVLYAGKSFFNIFSFEMVKGDAKTALEVPFTMVLTEEMARKYFGDEDPLGKTIKWDNKFDYTVTGVVKKPPANCHFTFNVLASVSTILQYVPQIESSWSSLIFRTYVQLQENTDILLFQKKIETFNDTHLAGRAKEMGGETRVSLQPLKQIHLHSNVEAELGVNSDIKTIYIFAAIAIAILLIASINFMNLATARSASRAKEVGLRKVMGAERGKLVFQFLGESFVFAAASLIVAMVIVKIIQPYYRNLVNREIFINYLENPWFAVGLLGIVLFVGIAAGSYPAFFLSSFQPAAVFKGDMHKKTKGGGFRSILVVFQFTVSIILIICTIIIFNQQRYLKNKDLGFDKKNLLVIALQDKDVRDGLESFKNEVLKIKGVVSAGESSMVPGEMYLFTSQVYPEGFAPNQVFRMDNFFVDHDFLKTLGIRVAAGRGFSKEITTDETDAVMINETAAKKLEWQDPVGKTINFIPTGVFEDGAKTVKRTVIGVYKDFHQRSLYAAIEPTFLQYVSNKGPIENRGRRFTLRLATGDIHGTIGEIQQTWHRVYPNHPIYHFFLDEFYDGNHRAEVQLGGIIGTFAIIAVIIACLGLFGLSSFTTEQRTKEIGIRKVLGSPVSSIIALLGRQFLRLVIIANIVAWPLAFYAMKKWLENFPYPVVLGLGTFILASFLSLLIALLTVGYQSIKAAHANPVDSLRME